MSDSELSNVSGFHRVGFTIMGVLPWRTKPVFLKQLLWSERVPNPFALIGMATGSNIHECGAPGAELLISSTVQAHTSLSMSFVSGDTFLSFVSTVGAINWAVQCALLWGSFCGAFQRSLKERERKIVERVGTLAPLHFFFLPRPLLRHRHAPSCGALRQLAVLSVTLTSSALAGHTAQ